MNHLGPWWPVWTCEGLDETTIVTVAVYHGAMRPSLAFVSALATLACKPPPEAPEDLDELCGYLYSHHADEDTAAMEAGLSNLLAWLDLHWEEASEGYVVTELTQATVDNLDGTGRSVEGILGLAMAHRSSHGVYDSAYAIAGTDQDVVFPALYDSYEREYLGDDQCFLDQECPRLEALEEMVTSYALGVTSTSSAHSQYLWAELEDGDAMVMRNWFVSPPEVNFDWISIQEQYYLNLFLPRGNSSYRLQAMWLVFEQDNVPEDLALSMATSDMADNFEQLDAYLEGAR